MTIKETAQIMAILQIAYPQFYKNQQEEEIKQAISLWSALFASEPFDIVKQAIHALIKTRTVTYPPVPGEITDMIYKITQPQELSEMEAWNITYKGICGNYKFEDMPEVVRKIIGSPGTLKQWGQMDIETINSVIQSNFMRSYKSKIIQEKEYAKLPKSARNMLESAKIKMIGG